MEVDLPFVAYFDFSALRDSYRKHMLSRELTDHPLYAEEWKIIEEASELYTGTRDESVLHRYKRAIEILTRDLYPDLLETNEIKALGLPLSDLYIRPTQRLLGVLEAAKQSKSFSIQTPDDDYFYIMGCLFIMSMHYGVSTQMNRPYLMDVAMKDGSAKTFRIFINADHCVFTPTEDFRELDSLQIKQLLKSPEDVELWKTLIPPGSFKMLGFTIVNMFDVTRDVTLERLKWYLVKRDALSRKGSRDMIKSSLATFIGTDNFKVGLSRYDQKTSKLARHMGEGWKSYALSGHHTTSLDQMYCEVSSAQLSREHHYLAWNAEDDQIDGVSEPASHVIRYLHEKGYQSIIFIPLVYGDEMIGLLELISRDAQVLSPMTYSIIESVLPVLTVSLYSFIENHQTQLESIIQQHYTSLHPSISWRFEEAAESRLQSPDGDDEDIIFSQVYPLFGQADIMSSSEIRNRAIQSDLTLQLKAAQEALAMRGEQEQLPIIQQLSYELDQHITDLRIDLSAGDELSLLTFIRERVDPVLQWMRSDSRYASYVETYDALLDPELGIVYRERKKFESSVSLINRELADFFQKKQAEAQLAYPHYCEIYKTDGVEYNLYIGQSIQPSRPFEEFHLKNLRLWQLMTCCEQEQLYARLRPRLPMDLEIRSLILCHDSPMAIKFRVDEKKFDVDGAYNIRYEIVKKRIDKAVVVGSGERLTKTGHLTVVYSQDKEREEYEQYFAYLASIGYLDASAEHLTLEDMPGATGLRALRAAIRYEEAEMTDRRRVISLVS